MINLFRNKKPKKTHGAATLIITIILLITSTMIIIFAANQGKILQKLSANQHRNAQAFQAAEAGLEYGISYLRQNSTAILANPISGFIQAFANSAITNVLLPNNTRFTIVYSNPIANNYLIIRISSTGTNDDSSATRTVSQDVAFGSLITTIPSTPITSKGAVSISGNSLISNPLGTTAISSASTISFGGSGTTTTTLGTGNAGSIQQNVAALSSTSQADFFATYFGTNVTGAKSRVANFYTSSSNTNYSNTLNGMVGTSIWIDQLSNSTTTINGNTTIGSVLNPVLLVINGNFSVSGNVVIYGFVYVIGSTGINTLTGNTQIIGVISK